MTNEEILKKAIEKAVENEYEYWDYLSIDNIYYSDIEPDIVSITFGDGRKENIGLYNIIFSHSFAKAFAIYLLKEKAKFINERVSPEYEEYEARLQIGDEILHPYDGFYFEDEAEDMSIKDLLKDDRIIEDLKDWLLKNMVLEKEPLLYLEKFLEEK